MAWFHSTAPKALDFEFNKNRYRVPPGGNFEVPDPLAYGIFNRSQRETDAMPVARGKSPSKDAPLATVEPIRPAPVPPHLARKARTQTTAPVDPEDDEEEEPAAAEESAAARREAKAIVGDAAVKLKGGPGASGGRPAQPQG